MSRSATRARRRRARNEKELARYRARLEELLREELRLIRCDENNIDFEANEELWCLLTRLANDDLPIWSVVRDVLRALGKNDGPPPRRAEVRENYDTLLALVAQAVAPHLAASTPGMTARRHEANQYKKRRRPTGVHRPR